MKILVFSDSHSSLRFMFRCVRAVKPEVMIHLGDYYVDGMDLRQEFPEIPLYLVPGNCDGYRCPPGSSHIQLHELGGVRFYMTHGHKHGVKSGTEDLLRAAREANADAVLYGHTHRVDICQEEDGLWVLNPGSCGFYMGSAGIIDIEDGKIRDIRLIRDGDIS